MSTHPTAHRLDDLLLRIRGEYLEMPGLRLNVLYSGVRNISLQGKPDTVLTFDIDWICNLFFHVTDLSTAGERQKESQILESIAISSPLSGDILVQGFDQGLIGHQRFLMPVEGRAGFDFKIDLQNLNDFNFFVDAWGLLQSPGSPCP